MTDDLQRARVEAAAEGMWNLYGDRGMFTHAPEHLRNGFMKGARAALAAADAHLPTVEMIADEIAGHPIGGGYYQTTVGIGEAQEMAEAVRALFGEVAGLT